MTASTPRPFLKWIGGKRQLLTSRDGIPGPLAAAVPESFGDYHEPMLGGGALFFHLAAAGRIRRAHLGDANERLVRTWRAVRDSVEPLIRALYARAHEHELRGVELFDEMAATNPDAGTDVDVAAWFIYLNRTSFNALYRVNREGRFNAPFNNAETIPVNTDNLRACSRALAGVEIRCEDFSAVRRARAGDLVYLDPPYLPLGDAPSFKAYTATGFDLVDHQRLATEATTLVGRGVHVLGSNADCAAARELYGAGFRLDTVQARRAVNSKGAGRGPVGELVIVGAPAARARRVRDEVGGVECGGVR
jgi:DNA adenine methylase